MGVVSKNACKKSSHGQVKLHYDTCLQNIQKLECLPMKISSILILMVVGSILLGCASSNVEMMGAIDPSDRTVSAPPGGLGILGPVKRKLVVNGWQVDEYDQVDTRYKLTVNTVRTQLLCLNEWSEVAYEIMFLDKRARLEVFRISVESCDSYSDVGDVFENAIREAESKSQNR